MNGHHRATITDLGAAGKIVIPEIDALNLVSNDVGVPLQDLTLRPGQHRRVSFRVTPGSSVEVALRAHAWLDLNVLDGSRAGTGGQPAGPPGPIQPPSLPGMVATAPGGTGTVGTGAPPMPAQPPATAPAVRPLTTAPGFSRVSGAVLAQPTTEEAVAVVRRAARRPLGGLDILNPGGVFDPFDPHNPVNPTDPIPPGELPPRPTFPVEVVVSIRGGAELGRETLHATTGSPSPARMTVDGIQAEDVVDVTFINRNPEPVICSTCMIFVERKIRTTTTRIDTEMFKRAFNGAIESLCPSIVVEDGQLRISLQGDLAHELKLHNITYDLGASFSGGATFESNDLEIMGLHEMIERVIALFQQRLGGKMVQVGINRIERHQLAERRQTHVQVPTFMDAVREAYFDPQGLLPEVVLQRITPASTNAGVRSRLRTLVDHTLGEFPILVGTGSHLSADPSFVLSYALKEIHGEWGPIGVEVPEIRATLYLTFNHLRKRIPAPFGDLPYDRLTVGTVRPGVHLVFDIADFDVDIDVPLWLSIVSVGTVNLGAFLVEQGLEELADYLAGAAEWAVPNALHTLLAERTEEYGEIITETLATIVDRDQHFHRSAANRNQIAISMINPDRLRTPHDPSALIRPSPVDGIEMQAPPVTPIDQGPGAPAVMAASPEQLLNRIDHFVFVMMENRSFDHMLGYLSHPQFDGRADVDGLDGSERALGRDFIGTRTHPLPGPFPAFRPNLPHDFTSIVRQINDGGMDGFVSEYAKTLAKTPGLQTRGLLNDAERALRFQTPDVVTTYDELAKEFTVCDRWFCSVPAGTYPNRACYYSGVTPALFNREVDFGYVSDLTIFDILDNAGVDWKLFESDITFLRVYERFRLDQERIRPIEEMGNAPLPAVTFIDPNFTGFPSNLPNNDDQPPTSVIEGQKFLKSVVDMVKSSPNWASTMLVITYDEHGGFADHVPPPGAPGSSHPPNGPVPISSAHPDATTYGVRVPSFVVSPLAPKGGVSSLIFDHATVFKTLLQRFAPQHANSAIIPERVRRSRHLGEVLVDQPVLTTATASTPTPTFLAAKPPVRPQVNFVEPEDPEDMVWALKQIGRPRRR